MLGVVKFSWNQTFGMWDWSPHVCMLSSFYLWHDEVCWCEKPWLAAWWMYWWHYANDVWVSLVWYSSHAQGLVSWFLGVRSQWLTRALGKSSPAERSCVMSWGLDVNWCLSLQAFSHEVCLYAFGHNQCMKAVNLKLMAYLHVDLSHGIHECKKLNYASQLMLGMMALTCRYVETFLGCMLHVWVG